MEYEISQGLVQRKGKNRAVKVVKNTEEALKEIKVRSNFTFHKNLLPVYKVKIREGHIQTEMRYVGKSLLDEVNRRQLTSRKSKKRGPISRSRVFSIFRQLVYFLRVMHEKGYIYKDLKLENLYYDRKKDRVYFFDFSASSPYRKGEKSLRDFLCSLHYAAPEIWRCTPYEGPEVDVWALGVCLFVLSSGFFPFGGQNPQEVYRQIEKEVLWFPKSIRSASLRDLLTRMLAFDPKQRIQLHEIFFHPYWISALKKQLQEKYASSNLQTVSSVSIKDQEDSQIVPITSNISLSCNSNPISLSLDTFQEDPSSPSLISHFQQFYQNQLNQEKEKEKEIQLSPKTRSRTSSKKKSRSSKANL